MEMSIGKKIAALRREKGLKQDELAGMLSVSPQAVSKWENDQTCPDISLLPELAKILGVTVDELLTGRKEAEITVTPVPEEKRKDIADMMLRIEADSGDGAKVHMNLPLTLVQAAVDAGVAMPGINGNTALQNINWEQILELVRHGAMGDLIEAESQDGSKVRIFAE